MFLSYDLTKVFTIEISDPQFSIEVDTPSLIVEDAGSDATLDDSLTFFPASPMVLAPITETESFDYPSFSLAPSVIGAFDNIIITWS